MLGKVMNQQQSGQGKRLRILMKKCMVMIVYLNDCVSIIKTEMDGIAERMTKKMERLDEMIVNNIVKPQKICHSDKGCNGGCILKKSNERKSAGCKN